MMADDFRDYMLSFLFWSQKTGEPPDGSPELLLDAPINRRIIYNIYSETSS